MSNLLSSLITPALIGLLITASFLVIVNDWRLGFIALAAQYLLAAVLIAQIAVWQVVVVKIIAGLLSVGILYLTGAEVHFGRKVSPPLPEGAEAAPASARFEFPTGLPFRVLAVLMVSLAAWNIATQSDFVLHGIPSWLNVAGYLLIALSLLNLGLTEEPMNAGLGLLTLLTGFGIFYTAVEPSLAVVALLAAVDFVIALAVGYLAFLHYAAVEKEASR
jgi:hypothetical protein